MFKNNIFIILVVLILLGGNAYLSTQYISTSRELKNIKNQNSETVSASAQASIVLNEFLDVVFNTRKTDADSRLKLENDIRQMKDSAITTEWDALVASKDAKASQAKALKIVGMLQNKI